MRFLSWPDGVAAELDVSASRLQSGRAAGDAPKLYALTERSLITTDADVLAWVKGKEVPPGYKCRAATRHRTDSAGGSAT